MPRRQFIRLTAYGAAAAGLAPSILAACGGGDDDAAEENGVKLSRPDAPVTLPTFDDIPAIEDGLQPETGTLKVYNYEEYISPDVLAAFQDEFGVTVEVTTFTSMDEAVTRLASGEVAFDVFFPTPDRLGQLAAGKLLQPLNKSYLPNFDNVWDSLRDPFYDQGSVYTVPYTLYTTGIGYRIDAVEQDAGRLREPVRHLLGPGQPRPGLPLEDDREVFGMALLRRDPESDVNTEDTELHRRRPRRCHRADRPRERQGRCRGVHGAAREAGMGPPVLVGRRDQRPVLPARGRVDREHRLLEVADRRHRQRHDRRAAQRRRSRCSPTPS